MDDNFDVSCHNEANFNLMLMPWQSVGPHLSLLASRARAIAISPRQSLQGLAEIDTEAWKIARSFITNKGDLNIANTISTAATWTQLNKCDIGYDTTDTCPHCQAPAQDIFHLICDCPATYLQQVRQQYIDNFHDLPLRSLPRPILLGIPLAMSADHTKTFWGQDVSSLNLPPRAKTLIGIKPAGLFTFSPTIEGAISTSANNGFSHPLRTLWNLENARQILAYLYPPTSTPQDILEDLPYTDLPPAPSQTDRYADGSVKCIKTPFAKLTSAGVWFPNRDSDMRPFTDLEKQFAHSQTCCPA
jgi:hypothetical protein